MTTEAQPPSAAVVDAFFTDSFNLGASLSELYRDEIHSLQQADGESEIPSPIPVYAMRNKLHIVEPGIWIRPDTFHQAYNLGADTQEVVETATAHYEQLREFGMKVVGHIFEPVEEGFEAFKTHGRYPTIMAGANYRFGEPLKYPAQNSEAQFGRTLSPEAIQALGLTTEALENAILAPLRKYYAWCKAEDAAYVLGGIESIYSYLHHPLGHIGLTEVSTTMGSVELGNLHVSEQRFQHLTDTLQAAT